MSGPRTGRPRPEARALTYVVGNAVGTLVVARWCGELDDDQLRTGLTEAPTAEEAAEAA